MAIMKATFDESFNDFLDTAKNTHIYSTILIAIVLAGILVAKRWRTAELQGGQEVTRSGATHAFLRPVPFPQLTPANLSDHEGRDYLYANKAIRFPYHQTMAHTRMDASAWIEPDHDYVHDLKFKAEVLERQGRVVSDIIDDAAARLGCQELMLELSTWLCIRFPNCFRWDGTDRKAVNNFIMQDTVDLYVGETLKDGVDALRVVSRLVQDDFLIALLSSKGDGSWVCAGGLVAFPGFYLLSDKINKSMFDVHVPVPRFNTKLLRSVERSLTRLTPETPIERTSWEIVDDEHDQFWAPIAGPLPLHSGAVPFLPHHTTGRAHDTAQFEDPAGLILRLDHQTFVKMPRSGAVMFGVHSSRRPLSYLANLPLVPKLLLEVHTKSDDELMRYKGMDHYRDSVFGYLEHLHLQQIERGIIRGDEKAQDFRDYKGARPKPSSIGSA